MRDHSEKLKMLDEAEHGPTEEQLRQAPVLDEFWFEIAGICVVATGVVTGHPSLGGHITTSPVIGFDLEERWMRTRSRFYRLGDLIEFVNADVRIIGAIDPSEAQKILTAMRKRFRSQIQ
jgi:hypothetical protein